MIHFCILKAHLRGTTTYSGFQVVGAWADGGASGNVPAKWLSARPQDSRTDTSAQRCPVRLDGGATGSQCVCPLTVDFAALRARASIVLIRTSVTGTVDSSQTNAHLVPTPLYV